METVYQTQWYNSLKKSPLTPPNAAFGIVWPILYVMMGVAAFMVWRNPQCGHLLCLPLIIFAIQLFFNLVWSPVFFRQQDPKTALIIIFAVLGFAAYTTYLFYQIEPIAGYLMIPYLLWLTFATYLNWYIVANN